jgi:superoxide dismutase, Fe-Mn family
MKNIEKKINLITEKIEKSENNINKKLFINEMKKIGIEKLPYSYSALKQFIDPETMKYHYNKHYKGYVKKLNDALSKKKYGDIDLEKIVKTIGRFDKKIRDNAGGAFNHALFWKLLTPNEQKPHGNILKQIKKEFKSYGEFKTKFETIAKERFGSGWVWLVLNKRNNLKIVSTPNQDNPLMNIVKDGGYPILGLDLWEHAYYLKYKNKREDYIKNFWKVVNWEFVNKLYDGKIGRDLNETLQLRQTLNEGKSERCNRKMNEITRFIFNNNPKVKWTFKKGIDKILQDVFPDNFYKKGEYSEDEMSGIYDLETKGRSVINKLNTNYSGFCVLLSDINQVLIASGKSPIKISGLPPKEQINKTYEFINQLNFYKDRIFKLDSSTFQNIMRILEQTNSWGEKREDDTVVKLKKEFGDSNVTKLGKLGGELDMVKGVDAEIILNGKPISAQIKPLGYSKNINGNIILFNTGNVKYYTTDWLIFTNKKETLIFNNDNTKIVDGRYIFPEESLIYTL